MAVRHPLPYRVSSRSLSRTRRSGTRRRLESGAPARGRPRRCASPSPRTAPCSSPSAASAASCCLRLHRMFLHAPLAVVRAVARSLRRTSRSADGEVRRFMNENLHRVRRCRAQLPPLLTAGASTTCSRSSTALNARFFGGAPARAPHLGPRAAGARGAAASPSAATIPCSRLIRIHPVLDRRDVPHLLPGERRLPRDAAPPPGRRPRPRRAAPSTTRARSARRRRVTPGTARRWPGRRRTCPTCCGPARTLDRQAQGAGRRRLPPAA